MTATDSLAIRRLTPEMLDHLPADDPAAQRSRRDLVRINALMLQPMIMASLLKRHVAGAPQRVLEIGAGDGRFSLAWARRMKARWPKVELTLLDRAELDASLAHEGIGALGWTVQRVTTDIFDFLAAPRPAFDLVVANLFLHHFEAPQIARIFAALDTGCFVATEPRRNRFAHLASRSLGLVGANHVSRHDAAASVEAGFRGAELTALWPHRARTSEHAVGPFTHAFAAVRA